MTEEIKEQLKTLFTKSETTAKCIEDYITELERENLRIKKTVKEVLEFDGEMGKLREAIGLEWIDKKELDRLRTQIEDMKNCGNCQHMTMACEDGLFCENTGAFRIGDTCCREWLRK